MMTRSIRKRSWPVKRGTAVLFLLWLFLATRITLAALHRESLSGDLALPAFALFVTSVLVLNRVWYYFRPVKAEGR